MYEHIIKMVHLVGLEPTTLRVETVCAIQLRHRCDT